MISLCLTPFLVALSMSERFPDAYLSIGPLYTESSEVYAYAAPGISTLLVFTFTDGCLSEFGESSPRELYAELN